MTLFTFATHQRFKLIRKILTWYFDSAWSGSFIFWKREKSHTTM